MRILFFSFFNAFIFTISVHASNWKHKVAGPEVLTDEIIMSVYKNETEPQIHNGVTVTNYFKEFDISASKSRKGCYVPKINNWLVQSIIYIRSKDDKSIIKERPRWQKIDEFDCQVKSGDFNTWNGTHQHEKEHYKIRDLELKKFWKTLEKLLKSTCESSEESAKMKILSEVESFLKLIKKLDTEDNPRRVEHKFYKKEFEKQTHKKCDPER